MVSTICYVVEVCGVYEFIVRVSLYVRTHLLDIGTLSFAFTRVLCWYLCG